MIIAPIASLPRRSGVPDTVRVPPSRTTARTGKSAIAGSTLSRSGMWICRFSRYTRPATFLPEIPSWSDGTDASIRSEAGPTRIVQVHCRPSEMRIVTLDALKNRAVVSAISCKACAAFPAVAAMLRRISAPAFWRSRAARSSFWRRKLTRALAVCRSIAASRSIRAASSRRSSSAIRCFRSADASSETVVISQSIQAAGDKNAFPGGCIISPQGGLFQRRRQDFRRSLDGSGPRPRHLGLLGGDELEQHRHAFLRFLDAALDGGSDVLGLGDALAIAAEGARHRGIVAGDVGGAILLGRDRHHLQFDRHREIVEQDRHDRNLLAHRGLEIHPREADRRIAPDVDAELVGPRELGAHREPQPVAELRGLAPAEIGEGFYRLPERRELVSGAAGIMGDDGVLDVDGVLQVPEHAIRVERRVVARELRHPFRPPLLVRGRDLGRDRAWIAIRCDGLADLFLQRVEHEAGVADETYPALDILVEVVGIERRMDDGFAGWHLDAEIGLGEGAADAEDHVGLGGKFRHRARHGQSAGAERQRMRLGE